MWSALSRLHDRCRSVRVEMRMTRRDPRPFPVKYGAVYTPKPLATFVAQLLKRVGGHRLNVVLDPACGEGALLSAIKEVCPKVQTIGIDRDREAIEKMPTGGESFLDDFILPKHLGDAKSAEYWSERLSANALSAVIANPPWSSDRVYSNAVLKNAGFDLAHGQYDSYALFVELTLNVLPRDAYYAFILPDSIFAAQNESLRRLLLTNTEVLVVARLGEKMFPGIFRGAAILVGRKTKPTNNCLTSCFRLDTKSRERCLDGVADLIDCFTANSHLVRQTHFLSNPHANIDVDARACESALIDKMKKLGSGFSDAFIFGRGVEVSKSGSVLFCQHCGSVHACRSGNVEKEWVCRKCQGTNTANMDSLRSIVSTSKKARWRKIFVGESLHRYRLSNARYIEMNVPGVDYKRPSLFFGPKILLRKTGLGIYAAIDEHNTLTNQTVYILHPKNAKATVDEMYYYLGVLNSRTVFYYYAKLFGENEWRSHPYLTKEVVFSLPAPVYSESASVKRISEIARKLTKDYRLSLDLDLENAVMDTFGLTKAERALVEAQMKTLPDLGALKEMKALNV